MNSFVKNSISFIKKESPLILSIIASGGVVVTAILVGKATPTAIEQIEAKTAEKGEKLTALETIKTVGMTYGPSALVGIATIGCILGANALNKRNQASLAAAYTLVSKNFADYKNALKELHGEEAHKDVVRHIANTKHNDTHPNAVSGFQHLDGIDALLPDTEEVLFYDPVSKRYFNATPARVLEAEYHLNRNYANRGEATLNEFYDFLGLEHIKEGNEIGWWISDHDEFYWVDFGHIRTEADDGTLEYIIIDYMFPPEAFDEID